MEEHETLPGSKLRAQHSPIVIEDSSTSSNSQASPKPKSKPAMPSNNQDTDMENSGGDYQLGFGASASVDAHLPSKLSSTAGCRRGSLERLTTQDKGLTRQQTRSSQTRDSDMCLTENAPLEQYEQTPMSFSTDHKSAEIGTDGGLKQEYFFKDSELHNKEPLDLWNNPNLLVGDLSVKQFQYLWRKDIDKALGTHGQQVFGQWRQQLQDDFRQLANDIPSISEATGVKISNTRIKRSVEAQKNAIREHVEKDKRMKGLLTKAWNEKEIAQLDAKDYAAQLASTKKDLMSSRETYETSLGDLQKKMREERVFHEARIRCQAEDNQRHTRNAEEKEANIKILRSQSQDLARQLLETRKELSKSERELLGAGSNKHRHKVSDDDLKSAWQQLSWLIRDLAASLAESIPPGGIVEDQLTRERLRLISRKSWGPEDLLQDPEMRPLLLQAYLWRVAERFLYPSDSWEAALTDDFESVRARLLSVAPPEEAPAMAAWFAEKWHSIEARIDTTRASRRTAITEADNLIDFLPDESNQEKNGYWLRNALRSILRDARELNVAMGASKAVFERDWLKVTEEIPLRLDDTTMESENSNPSTSKVMFTISPLLVKHGNADGRRHDSHFVLMKAKVALVPDMLNKESDERGDDRGDEDIDMDGGEESDVESETESDTEITQRINELSERESMDNEDAGMKAHEETKPHNHWEPEEALLSLLGSQ